MAVKPSFNKRNPDNAVFIGIQVLERMIILLDQYASVFTNYLHPQAQGEPSQKNVKKVGKSKRYVTNGKKPLTCVELKCPEDVTDKAAFFHKELKKLTKDMEIKEPKMPEGEFLLDKPNVKVRFSSKKQKVTAWLTFETKGLLEIRRELYALTSEIDKCFVINEASVCQQK